MHRANPNYEAWERYKDVNVPWKEYDEYNLNGCKRILDLTDLFGGVG